MVRARNGKRRLTMATIGTFKKTGSNEFTGEIVTLSVQAKNVRIVPDQRATGDNAPQPPGLGRPRRNRRRLVQALERGPRLSGPQARRSELQRPDLRQPLRRRGQRHLLADLVPPQRAPGRLTPGARPRPKGRGLRRPKATESVTVKAPRGQAREHDSDGNIITRRLL